jgi:hypothetical protein
MESYPPENRKGPLMSIKRKPKRIDIKKMFKRKISATLLDFAKPILDLVDENTTEEDLSAGFMVAITVWNSMVFDEWFFGERCLDKVRSRLLKANKPRATHLLEILAERKKRFFSDDLRAIGHHSFSYKDGNLHLHAEARMDQAVYKALSTGKILPISRGSSAPIISG